MQQEGVSHLFVRFFFFFYLTGEHAGVWFLDLKSGAGSTGRGQPHTEPDVVMTMDSADFSKMFKGKGFHGNTSAWSRVPHG